MKGGRDRKVGEREERRKKDNTEMKERVGKEEEGMKRIRG